MKVYKSDNAEKNIYKTYDELLSKWGISTEEKDIPTTYGTTHVICSGDRSNPPLVLFHGVGDDSALMWIFNAKELAKHFSIYAIDTLGGPGKSCPSHKYNKAFDEIQWIDNVFDGLGLESAYVAGVSMGSYITQHYGIMRPNRVIKMICMSGTISVKERGKPFKNMLKVFLPEALFPTKGNVLKLIKKMTGDKGSVLTNNPAIMEHYAYLLKGFNNMAMANHKIKCFDEIQLSAIRNKSLFLLGEADPLATDRDKEILSKYHMKYQFFPGVGHGINHEISEKINKIMIEYFS